MSFILGGQSRESGWTDPRSRPGYVSPFGRRNPSFEGNKWKMVARELKRRHPEWPQSEEEIVGELDYQEHLKGRK